MLFGVEEAQERFEELMTRAAAGEEILAVEGQRIAQLIPIACKHPETQTPSDGPDFLPSDAIAEGDG